MSTFTRDEVERVAGLARIDLTTEELDRLAGQLDAIVDAVSTVTEAVGPDIPTTTHPLPLSNVLRTDKVEPSLSPEDALSCAPEQEAGQFKVPQIIGEESV